jgi:hypothetical protein
MLKSVIDENLFGISDYSDLKNMLGKLKGDFETQHIASELGHNMLEEGNKGKIVIEKECVINQIKFKNKNDLSLKKLQLQAGLSAAKSYCTGDRNSVVSYGKPHPENRGRGLSSILMMGWEIKIQEIQNQYLQIIVQKVPSQIRQTA